MAKKTKKINEVLVEANQELENEVVDSVEEEVVEDTYEPMPVGIVTNCHQLNLRSMPDKTADIVAVVPVGTELRIDMSNSNDEWYDVWTASGFEGFCMRQFVTVKQ